MSGSTVTGVVAVVLVTVATLAIGSFGLRLSRTTSDFLVASRTVRPGLNATAIGGEYLSAASFLGAAGLLLVGGADMLWYPVGWTAGYLVLLVLVAAPLRRSGAYTLPDFAQARFGGPGAGPGPTRGARRVRAACTLLVVGIGWLYLVPQFQGAGLTLRSATGAPVWVGVGVVGLVVVASVVAGGMRSVTFVQAFQYWLKLTALLVPAAVLAVLWLGDGRPRPLVPEGWSLPLAGPDGPGLYTTYSLVVATFLGTMGLPHVVVRFYTNPDGRAARRTTLVVLGLLGAFYVLPPVFAALGRVYAPALASGDASDTVVLDLPRLVVGGVGGELLTGLVTAGAFAAFLSTSSGLGIAVAGVVSQSWTRARDEGRVPRGLDRLLPGRRTGPGGRDGVAAFRTAGAVAVGVPCLAALAAPDVSVARSVGIAFAVAASTFAPLLLLGIWWRGLTDAGALAGLAVGALGSGVGVAYVLLDGPDRGWTGALLGHPAAWSVPFALFVMVAVSRATPRRVPAHTGRFLLRLHAPEGTPLTTP